MTKNKGEGLARWLIQQAARIAPPDLSERLAEEWLADLESRQGVLARLRLGVGCCWATRVIAHERATVAAAAAATTTGSKALIAFGEDDGAYFSRRSIVVLLIMGLHIALVFAFMNGLGHAVIAKFTGPMAYVPIEDRQPHHEPPPLPPVNLQPKPWKMGELPTTPIPTDSQTPEVTETVALPETKGEPGLPVSAVVPVKRVLGGPGKGFPVPDDFYPADAIRKGQEGSAIVRTCVDDKGRLTEAPAIATSSGVPALDDGAMRLARAGSGHYRPTTENGVPVTSCYEYRVVYHIKHDTLHY
jgi:protein TonB